MESVLFDYIESLLLKDLHEIKYSINRSSDLPCVNKEDFENSHRLNATKETKRILEWVIETIKSTIEGKIHSLEEMKIPYFGCSFSNYLSSLDQRIIDFKSDFPDAEEINFYFDQYRVLSGSTPNSYYSFDEPFVDNILSDRMLKSMEFSINKTIEFLKSEIQKRGYTISENTVVNEYIDNPYDGGYTLETNEKSLKSIPDSSIQPTIEQEIETHFQYSQADTFAEKFRILLLTGMFDALMNNYNADYEKEVKAANILSNFMREENKATILRGVKAYYSHRAGDFKQKNENSPLNSKRAIRKTVEFLKHNNISVDKRYINLTNE